MKTTTAKFLSKFVEGKSRLFLLLLVLLYFFLGFHEVVFRQPFGIHFIRQTDCLAFVKNYLNNGFTFFQPQVFNLNSIDGKAACEFPLLYYITALVSVIFNRPEFVLRILTLFIASFGFYCLFRLIRQWVKDTVYGLAFTFLFISSTVLLYYSNNFLPDAAALGFSLSGWYYFYGYMGNPPGRKHAFIAFSLFALGSLLKVTCFVNAIAAILTAVFLTGRQGKGVHDKWNKIKPAVFSFLLAALMVLTWNIYAVVYNKTNHDTYFLVKARPIWTMTPYDISTVWEYVTHFWYSKYYYQSTWHFFGILILSGTLFYKWASRNVLVPAGWLAFGTLCYVLLFFAQFRDHDYYFIAIIPAIIFTVMNGFIALQNRFPDIFNSLPAKAGLVLLCMLSLNYARQKLNDRYRDTSDKFAAIGTKLNGAEQWLNKQGIPNGAKIVVVGDLTPNGGLYFINRQGWNVRDTSFQEQQALKNYIHKGADYLLIADTSMRVNVEGNVIAMHRDVILFKPEH